MNNENGYYSQVDLSQKPSLEKVHLYNFRKLESLDLSECSSLVSCYLYCAGDELYNDNKMMKVNMNDLESLNRIHWHAVSNPIGNIPSGTPLSTMHIETDGTKLEHLCDLDFSIVSALVSAYIYEISSLHDVSCINHNSIKRIYLRDSENVNDVVISGNQYLEDVRLYGFHYDNNPTYAKSVIIADNPSLVRLDVDYANLTGGFTYSNCPNLTGMEMMYALATEINLSGINAPSAELKIAYNSYIERIELNDITYPRVLDMSNNSALKDIEVHGCLSANCSFDLSNNVSLTGVWLSGNSFSSSRLNTICDKIVAKSPSGGTIDLRDNVNLPSQTKLDNLSNHGWTVLTS